MVDCFLGHRTEVSVPMQLLSKTVLEVSTSIKEARLPVSISTTRKEVASVVRKLGIVFEQVSELHDRARAAVSKRRSAQSRRATAGAGTLRRPSVGAFEASLLSIPGESDFVQLADTLHGSIRLL